MRGTQCPYCHQQSPFQPPPSTPIQDSQQEMEIIRNEINRLENLLEELNARRVKLLRGLNRLQPTISVFPPETLALIFQHACDLTISDSKHNFGSPVPIRWISQWEEENSNAYYCMQLVLCAVSSQWRQIVLSTPGLWVSVDLDVRKMRKIKQQSAILRRFLENSANLSFSLGIQFSHKLPPSSILLHETVDHLIYGNTPRIRNLRLIRPPNKWIQFMSLLPLSEFSVKYCPKTDIRIPDECSHLTLTELYCDIRMAPCHSLTVLRLKRLPVDVCLELLTKCSNLVEYRNREPEVHLQDDIMLPDSPFTLPRLEVFEWHAHCSMNPIFDEAMCEYADMPSLRTLVWNEMMKGDYGYALPFFKRLSSKLTDLQLVCCSTYDAWAVIDSIPDHLNVERISLSFCDDMISRFKRHPYTHSWKFPKLRSLTIHHHGRDFTNLDLVEIFEGRLYEGMVDAFRLEITDLRELEEPIPWDLESKQRLRGLIARGLKAEIVENGKVVDWLYPNQDGGWSTHHS